MPDSSSYWTKKNNAIYLGLFFLAYCFILFKFLFSHLEMTGGAFDQFTWLIGPLIYFYASKTQKLTYKDLLHFVPFVICCFGSLAYFKLGLDNSRIEIMFSPLVRSVHSIVYVLFAALEAKDDKWMKRVIISVSVLLVLTYTSYFKTFDDSLILTLIVFALITTGTLSIQFFGSCLEAPFPAPQLRPL